MSVTACFRQLRTGVPLQSIEHAIHQRQIPTIVGEEEMALARGHDSLDGPECLGMVP
jgi:hypothetical protein